MIIILDIMKSLPIIFTIMILSFLEYDYENDWRWFHNIWHDHGVIDNLINFFII